MKVVVVEVEEVVLLVEVVRRPTSMVMGPLALSLPRASSAFWRSCSRAAWVFR